MKVVGLSNLSDAYKNYLVVLIKRTLVSMTTEKKRAFMYINYITNTALSYIPSLHSHKAIRRMGIFWNGGPHTSIYTCLK